MAFESTEGSAPPPYSVVGSRAASLETVAGCSVRQGLEEGPVKGLKASGGQQRKVGEGAAGRWIRDKKVQKVDG